MTLRQVRFGRAATEKAKSLYPPGGSAEGRPSYTTFMSTIAQSAIFQFGNGFDELPDAIDGVAIKAVITIDVPFFPATVFYGLLGDDGVVEIIDFEPDETYFGSLDERGGD